MKKYSFIVLYFIVLQTAAQNSNVLKGSFSAAKETEIRLMGFIGTKDTLLASEYGASRHWNYYAQCQCMLYSRMTTA
jgi:hypothetical protein